MIAWNRAGWPLLQAQRPAARTGPLFVRRQAVEPYHEVIADLGEAAGQQMAAARDASQILIEPRIRMES